MTDELVIDLVILHQTAVVDAVQLRLLSNQFPRQTHQILPQLIIVCQITASFRDRWWTDVLECISNEIKTKQLDRYIPRQILG
jgi:hypothetical protein